MHLNHPQTVPLLPGPWTNASPKPVPGVRQHRTTAQEKSPLGLLLWLGSQSSLHPWTASQILNPRLNCPWRIFIETSYSSIFCSSQVFCLENPHALSQIFSSLLPCCGHGTFLSLFLSITPTPHHPPIPTGPRSALQRAFLPPPTLGRLKSSSPVKNSSPTVLSHSLPEYGSLAEGLGMLAPGQ